MKAPRSNPNISASRRVSGIAAQFDVDEGPPGPGACPVERAGHEPLAAAGLSLDQDGWETPNLGRARDQAGDLVPDGNDSRAFADKIGHQTHGIRHPAP